MICLTRSPDVAQDPVLFIGQEITLSRQAISKDPIPQCISSTGFRRLMMAVASVEECPLGRR